MPAKNDGPGEDVTAGEDVVDVAAPASSPPSLPLPALASPPPSTARKHLRLGVFILIALGLQAGPITTQVLELDVPLRGWHMFQGKGRDICDVRFTERTADGRESRRTVEDIVRGTGVSPLRSSAFRLGDVDEIRSVARRYCARSKGSQLRASARCGHRDKGWRKVLRETEDLCLAAK